MAENTTKVEGTSDSQHSNNAVLAARFRCRECGWVGTEAEMRYADNGWDYTEDCPSCGDTMFSNGKVYCDAVENGG